MTTIITAGASQTATIPKGFAFDFNAGSLGMAVIGPGPQANVTIGINGSTRIGPYDRDQVVYLTATSAMVYDVKPTVLSAAFIPSDSGSAPYSSPGSGLQSIERSAFVATDAGSAWSLAPASLGFTARLLAGASTTVLVEGKDKDGVVTTIATIVADTLNEVLQSSVLMRDVSSYRFRRTSGAGDVSIFVQV